MGERWWIVRLQQVAVVTLLASTFLAGAVHTQQYGQSAQYTECDNNKGFCVSSGQCGVRTFRLRSNRCPTFEEVCCPKSSFPPERLLSMTPYSNRTPKALAPTVPTAQPSVSPNEAADDDLIPATDIPDESVEIAKLSVTVAPTPVTSSPSNEIAQNALPTNSSDKPGKDTIATNVPSVQGAVVESSTTLVPQGNTSSIDVGNDKSGHFEPPSSVSSPNALLPKFASENFTYSKCGQRNPDGISQHKVQEKFRAEYGEFPWTVALFRRAEELTFCCNGVLIGERVVLTTAHCVILCGNLTSEIVVRVGEWNISTPMPIPSEEIVVKDIRTHHQYEHFPQAYNIALLKLELPVQYRATVQQVCLNTESHTLAINTKMIASGWSNDPNEQQSTTHQVQKQFILLHVELQNCESNYQSFDNKTYESLHSRVLCATSNRSDQERISDKEEGSPVVVKVSDEYRLHGLVSWGFKFKEEAVRYTVMTNVHRLKPWIERMMDE